MRFTNLSLQTNIHWMFPICPPFQLQPRSQEELGVKADPKDTKNQ